MEVNNKPVETVLCYIERDNQVLMLLRNKRKQDMNKGKWLGIGGHIEYNETPDDALVREVKEETNLTLTDFVKRGVIWFINGGYTEIMHLYQSASFTGALMDCDEGTLEWKDKASLMQLNLWEGDRIFLEEMYSTASYFEMKLYYENDRLIRSEKL